MYNNHTLPGKLSWKSRGRSVAAVHLASLGAGSDSYFGVTQPFLLIHLLPQRRTWLCVCTGLGWEEG